MNDYTKIFIDKCYPSFLDKYLSTKTLNRLKHITQFCGCDYTRLYSPLFLYTRFDHSLTVAHMTWHFTHDKKETIVALLHDVGTPCFAHCIDCVFGDYINQESSEKNIVDILKQDKTILECLKEDGVSLDDIEDLSNYHILENKSPKLCTDRLDGVLHTCYIWLHTHTLEQIKEVYDNIIVLKNEDGIREIAFKNIKTAEKFVSMVYIYAKELQGNTDKYVTKYVAEIVQQSFKQKLISIEDLYTKKEEDLCGIFNNNFASWKTFTKADFLNRTDIEPQNKFYISFKIKKRNVIPLVNTTNGAKRIIELSNKAKKIYEDLKNYKDTKYAYIEEIEKI